MNTDKSREALQELVDVLQESMRTGGWVPTPLHQSFILAMAGAAKALAQPSPPEQVERAGLVDSLRRSFVSYGNAMHSGDHERAEMMAERHEEGLAALAAQPATASARASECQACKGSEFVGFKRGIRCGTCDGTGRVEQAGAVPQAPANSYSVPNTESGPVVEQPPLPNHFNPLAHEQTK